MDSVKGTVARIGKNGIPDHKHGAYGWHWASAGHRDNGAIHAAANVAEPTWIEGQGSPAHKATYAKAVSREVIYKIPSKAKVKA